MKILEILQRIYMWRMSTFVATSFILFEGQFVIGKHNHMLKRLNRNNDVSENSIVDDNCIFHCYPTVSFLFLISSN